MNRYVRIDEAYEIITSLLKIESAVARSVMMYLDLNSRIPMQTPIIEAEFQRIYKILNVSTNDINVDIVASTGHTNTILLSTLEFSITTNNLSKSVLDALQTADSKLTYFLSDKIRDAVLSFVRCGLEFGIPARGGLHL